jgi:hypothetical protein
MAGSKSDAFENLLLNHILGNVSFAAPGTIWVGLWTAALTDASTGSTGGEVSGGAYARVSVAAGTANWNAASGGTVTNAAAITFPAATADWGTITHAAILNAASAGTILYWWDLNASKIVQNGDTASFAIAAITISES